MSKASYEAGYKDGLIEGRRRSDSVHEEYEKRLKEMIDRYRNHVRGLQNEALLNENLKLKALLLGQQVCDDPDADAKDCPLYDEGEPYRCKRDRFMRELDIEDGGR